MVHTTNTSPYKMGFENYPHVMQIVKWNHFRIAYGIVIVE